MRWTLLLVLSVYLGTLSFIHELPSAHAQDIIFGDEAPPQKNQPGNPQNPEVAERRPQFGQFGNGGFNPFQIAQNVIRPITTGLQQFVDGLNPNANGRPTPARPTPPPFTREPDNFGDELSPDCTTFRNTDGFCMPIQSCTSLRRFLVNRPQITVNRVLRRSYCGFSGFVSLVCCPEPDGNIIQQPANPRPTQPQPPVFVTTTTTKSPFQIITNAPTRGPPPTPTRDPFDGVGPVTLLPPRPKPQPTSVPVLEPEDSIDIRTGCGFSNASHSRIVGGREAQKGAWPWIAALGYRDEKGAINYLCGGTLISATHVITAGHCVHNRNDLKTVRLGDHDLFSDADGLTPVNIPVESVIPNPNYNPTSFQNDIAILKLAQPVPFTLQVHPICLPKSAELRANRFEKSTPFVAGWGAIEFNGPSSAQLREVQVPVVADSVCQEKYKPFKNTKVDDTNICAGYTTGKMDACQGDSGGPLMQPTDSSNYVLIGVVSFGFRCAEPGFPGVYSRVTTHMDWIEQVVTQK